MLVSIPNLGQDFANAVTEIEVGKSIRVIGKEIKLADQDGIMAAEIYLK